MNFSRPAPIEINSMTETNPSTIPVALAPCAAYDPAALAEVVGTLFQAIGWQPPRGARILVKPNLLAPTPPDFLPCTNPLVVRAVCEYLLALDVKVTVGDSPSFGTGRMIAKKIGLTQALADLPVDLIDLNRPRLVKLPSQRGLVAISRQVQDFDLILNLPKLKVHRMLGLSGAVKNHFGCVTSVYKAVLHAILGDRRYLFESMLVDLLDLLPPSVSLLDAVVAMHVTGPVVGQPFPLGLLAASPSAPALDTAMYTLLQLSPEDVPIWQECRKRNLPGAHPADLTYPLESLASFRTEGFVIPATLQPVGFHPYRILKRLVINSWSACCDKR
jgi:uncharacterized protein (DUF362 family)